MVGKHDSFDDDFTRILCLPHGRFKKPRELTWITGVILVVLTVSFGVTRYSLPWDQIGY